MGNKKFSMRDDYIHTLVLNQLATRQEGSIEVYNDGCWEICVEVHPYGNVRIWVSYDDKRSNDYDSSLVYVNNNRACGTGFKLKEQVERKIISIWNDLSKDKRIALI